MNLSEHVFNHLFENLYPSLMIYASRFLDQENAEDVVQDAFAELWEKQDTIEIGDQIASFLYRSVYTKSLNALKHISIVNKYSAAKIEVYNAKIKYFSPDHSDIIRQIENKELKKEIYEIIDKLPERGKEVFKLSYLHGMKNKDIAEILGISLRTVEAHMYQTLKILRGNLHHLLQLILLILIICIE